MTLSSNLGLQLYGGYIVNPTFKGMCIYVFSLKPKVLQPYLIHILKLPIYMPGVICKKNVLVIRKT